MKIPGVWKILSKFLYTRMFSLKKKHAEKMNSSWKFLRAAWRKIFSQYLLYKKWVLSRKNLASNCSRKFSTRVHFFPSAYNYLVLKKKKKSNSSWKFLRAVWQKIFSRYLLYKKWLISRKNLASNCSQKFSTRVHFFKIFAFS